MFFSRHAIRKSLALIPALTAALFAVPAQAAGPFGVNGAIDFVNVMSQPADPWGAVSGTFTQDSNGWPSCDATIAFFDGRKNKPWNGPDINGTEFDTSGDYKLTFTGQATLAGGTEDSAVTLTILNQIYNSGTNTTTADVIVPADHFLNQLTLTNTKRLPGDTPGDGFTNLRLIRPGYAANTTQVFTNGTLNAYGPGFSSIRCMSDLLNTNGYSDWSGANLIPVQWADRVKVTDAYFGGTPVENDNTAPGHQGHGIPWEYVALLGNQTGHDLWINMPAGATDDYVTKVAQLLKFGSDGVNPYTSTQANPVYAPLNPNLHIYVEYSNEVWNYSFQQYTYNSKSATDEVSLGGSVLNNDGSTDSTAWAERRIGERLKQISADFVGVYGAGSLITTIRPVWMWAYDTEFQNSNWGPAMDQTFNWFERTYGVGSFKNNIYGVGVAQYYSNSPGDNSSVNAIMDGLWTGSDQTRSRAVSWEALATYYGVKQVGYEGGTSLIGGAQGDATRDPRETASEAHHYLANWFATGADVSEFFSMKGGIGQYGDWLLLEDFDHLATPKFLGAEQIISAAQPAITDGNVLPSGSGQSITIDAGQYEESGRTPGSGPSFTPPFYDDFYFLRAAATGTYTISLTGSQAANIADNIYIDDRLLGAVSMPTGSSGTSATVSTGSIGAGFHTIRVDYEYINGATSGTASPTAVTITLSSGGGTTVTPSAPEILYVTSGNAQVALSWQAATLASSYNIKRGAGSGGPFTTVGTSATNSYTDTSAVNGTQYYYVVTGVNSAGEGGNSPQLPAMPVPAKAAVPTVSITAGGDDSTPFGSSAGLVNLSWASVPNATGYNVYRSTVNGSGFSNVSSQIGTTFADAGLTFGTAYYYQVTSVNSLGESAASTQVSATPNEAVPSAPTSLTSVASSGKVALKWTSPPFMAPTFPEDFHVYRSVTSGGPYTLIAQVATDNLLDTSAANGTTYYYVVTASNGVGESPRSNQVPATPTAAGTVSVDCGGAAAGSFVADFDFSGGTTASTASAIDTSLLSDPAPSAVYQSARVGNGSGFTYTFSGLAANGQYNVRLHFAELTGGTLVGQRVFNVVFNGNTLLANYDIMRRAGAVNRAVVENIPTTADATGKITITFAYGPTGPPLISGIEVGYLPPSPGGAPTAPTGLAGTPGNSQVALSWNSSTGATSYNIYRGTTAGGESGTAIATGIAATSYTNTGLTNGTTYYYTVKAVSAGGTSGASNEASATPTATPIVSDNSFETPSENGSYAYNVTGTAWTFTASSGIQANGSAWGAASAPDGVQTAMLQGLGSVSQVVNFTTTGTYTINFQAAQRSNFGGINPVAVSVDGVQVGSNITPGSGSFAAYSSAVFTISTTGNHTIKLAGTNNTGDNTSFVDLVTIAAAGVTVPNNSFEIPSVGAANYQYNPAGATWTFAGESGIQSNGSAWGASAAPDGTQTAFLQGLPAQVLGKISQTVNFPAAGTYTLQFQAAQRSGYGIQPIAIKVDGTQAGSNITPAGTSFQSYASAGFTVTSGNHTIELDATDNASDKASFVDLVTIATASGSAPSAPAGLTATAGDTQVVLSWTASTGATAYDVKRSTVSGSGYVTVSSPTTTSYTNTGLTNGTTYYFVVDAKNANGVSGNSNQASATPVASGTILAQEAFAEATGALQGAGSAGNGWAGAWNTQNNSVTIPGFNIVNTTPLTYTGVPTSGNYAIGGDAYQSTGRLLDVTAGGTFGANGYLSGGLIGASGKTVWLSVLMRKDAATEQSNNIWLQAGGIAWGGTSLVGMGYFGTPSDSGGNRYWSLSVGSTVYPSNVAITTGSTALLVVSITFGATNTINFYVNPTSLGGSAPTATLTQTTTTNLAFQGLAYYGGDGTNQSSIDELRFGTTYSIVTP